VGKKHRRPEPHRPGTPIQKALAFHQAGNFPEAEAIYRSLPPSDPNVLQLLGVLLCQTGRASEGITTLERAVNLKPDHVEALSNLGVAYHEAGRFKEALTQIERALVLDPNRPDLIDKRGFILQDLGRHEEAVVSFRLALEIDPRSPDTWFHLGNSLQELQDGEGAAEAFRKVLQFRPLDHEAWTNLGNALRLLKQVEESLAAFRRSIDIRPTAEAYYNMATVLVGSGDTDEGIKAAGMAVQLEPKKASYHIYLGILLDIHRTTPQALKHFRKALELNPTDVETQIRIAVALNQEGRYAEGQREFDKIPNPSDGVRMLRTLLVPIIPTSTQDIVDSRNRTLRGLEKLREEGLEIEDASTEVSLTNFTWSYHSESELPIQKSVVETYRMASPELFWESPYLDEPRSGKLKVGVLSSLVRKHTIGKLFLKLITGLPAEDIEVIYLDCATQNDDWSQKLNSQVDHAYRLPKDKALARTFIAEQRLDALFYPEIGMDAYTYYMAFSRLAPLQFMTWGHPVSTALPHMDVFLSSEDLEREGSQVDYSERLVKFPSLMTVFERPTPQTLTRADIGLPEDKRIYTCPQTLFKLHPDMDLVFGEILRRDDKGLLVLITGQEGHWDELIMERYRRTIPDVCDRIMIIRRLNADEYIGLCENADVVLDTFYFGGGNSSLEAFSVGSPIVSWPGAMLRGRITLTQYRAMGIDDLIARDPEHYIELALQVAKDSAWHRELKKKILERNEVLYDNPKPIAELQAFLRSECRR
jgi:protein O-GlcNAc transferase